MQDVSTAVKVTVQTAVRAAGEREPQEIPGAAVKGQVQLQWGLGGPRWSGGSGLPDLCGCSRAAEQCRQQNRAEHSRSVH